MIKELIIFVLLGCVLVSAQSKEDSLKQAELRTEFILVQKQIASTDSTRIKLQGISEYLQYKYQMIESKKKRK